ncbi:MAG TPA: hypothetical protein DIU39_08230 [Flavobacteriales bacterium]|nr:hypothetical protein [Flavobacteriales bacterium]|tara:strand:- start:1182 stop:2684 length:1503 start_codon:yes stop_codon:yes gene_type:complete
MFWVCELKVYLFAKQIAEIFVILYKQQIQLMDDDFDFNDDFQRFSESISRFENMIKNDTPGFFDVEEIEYLIDFYMDKNQMSKVEKIIEIGESLHPYSIELQLKKAQFYQNIHRPNKSLKLLNKLEQIEPTNIDLLYLKASVYSQLRENKKSIEYYQKLLPLVEEDELEEILMHIAFEYENLRNYHEAVNYFKQVLKNNPGNETAVFELTFCYEITNQLEEGVKFFQKFLDYHPYSSSAWYNLGTTYFKLGLFEKAIDAFEFVIAINEHYTPAYYGKAGALFELERYNEAINTYFQVFDIEEPDAQIYHNIAESYEKLEDYTQAIQYYKKAIALNPIYSDAYMGMAVSYNELGQNKSALFFAKKGVELDEKNADFQYIFGDILKANGFYEEAILAYSKVIQLLPDTKSIWLDLAETFREYLDIEHAIEVLHKGLEQHADYALYHYRLTAYYLMKNDITDAVKHMEKAIHSDASEVTELVEFYPECINFEEIILLIENIGK